MNISIRQVSIITPRAFGEEALLRTGSKLGVSAKANFYAQFCTGVGASLQLRSAPQYPFNVTFSLLPYPDHLLHLVLVESPRYFQKTFMKIRRRKAQLALQLLMQQRV